VDWRTVLDFWFEEIDPSYWFKKDEQFDAHLKRRFALVYRDVLAGLSASWRSYPEGRLAEIIVLDQFSRNMFRETPQSFSADELALHLARECVRVGDDQKLSTIQSAFVYMPYMHSENPAIHVEAVKLFSQEGLEENLKFELMHKEIIDRFGRYPHRNKILGRTSTQEEIEFLKLPGSSF